MNLENIVNAYSQYSIYRYGNTFAAAVPSRPNRLISDSIYRSIREDKYMVVNTEEMASLWHMPIPSTETPNINWLGARKAPPPTNMPKEGIVLGRAVYRGEETIEVEGLIDGETDKLILGEIDGDTLGLLDKLALGDTDGLTDVLIDGERDDEVEGDID